MVGCGGGHDSSSPTPLDPDTAPRVPVDRFSTAAGTMMVRDATNNLPGPNAPIDFDEPPFITRGLGPGGEHVRYYNFDIQPDRPAILYQIHHEGEDTPVAGQLPIINVIPGDAGYSDFWRVYRIIAPTDYVANTVTSFEAVYDYNLGFDPTERIINCPAVPEGSTATLRVGGGTPNTLRAWYNDQVVSLFTFEEAPLSVTHEGDVPVSPIYVTFTINPDRPGGGPPSGVVTEAGTDQTHNVLGSLPGAPDYSPFWLVQVYDNTAFDTVTSLTTAQDATRLMQDMARVNCPLAAIDTP